MVGEKTWGTLSFRAGHILSNDLYNQQIQLLMISLIHNISGRRHFSPGNERGSLLRMLIIVMRHLG